MINTSWSLRYETGNNRIQDVLITIPTPNRIINIFWLILVWPSRFILQHIKIQSFCTDKLLSCLLISMLVITWSKWSNMPVITFKGLMIKSWLPILQIKPSNIISGLHLKTRCNLYFCNATNISDTLHYIQCKFISNVPIIRSRFIKWLGYLSLYIVCVIKYCTFNLICKVFMTPAMRSILPTHWITSFYAYSILFVNKYGTPTPSSNPMIYCLMLIILPCYG